MLGIAAETHSLSGAGEQGWKGLIMATITGTSGNDILPGTPGADTMSGLAGNDTYIVNECDDVVIEQPGEGTDTVQSSVTFVLPTDVENLTLTGTASIDATGNALDNVLIGNSGFNMLTSGAGVDTLLGGGGDDVLVLGANLTAADHIDGGIGSDTLRLDGDYSAGVTFGATTVVNVERFKLADGNSYQLTLNDATNLAGLKVDGGALTGANALILDGSAEKSAALTAIGGAGDDTLIGGNGNDMLIGGAGADTLTGGLGIDTVSYDGSANGVTVDLTDNANNAGGDAAGDILTGVENLIGSANDDSLTGNNGNNKLDGGSGDDTLVSGGGNDILLGGDGNDTLVLGASLTAADKVDGAGGTDTLSLAGDYSKGLILSTNVLNIENIDLAAGFSYKLTLSDSTNNGGLAVDGTALGVGQNLYVSGAAEAIDALTVSGGAGNDTLIGGKGDDVLAAGAGNDILQGGIGNDTFNLGGDLTAADKIDGGLGNDTLVLDGDYSAGVVLGAATVLNVEKISVVDGNNYKLTLNNATNSAGLTVDATDLTVGSAIYLNGSAETTSSLTALGGAGDDTLIGGAGADLLIGGLGADTLNGGLGIDTASYAASTSGVTVDLTDSANNAGGTAAGDVLSNVENIIGSDYNDSLKGGLAADQLDGGLGDDTLIGGAGRDTLLGGAGNDTFLFAGNLTALDKVDGGDDDDTLILDGNYAAGLVFGATTVVNVEDIILSDGNSYKLTLNDATNNGGLTVDASALSAGKTLILNGAAEHSSALVAIGGAGADVLTGGAGNDILIGGAGADTLNGGVGIDTASYAGAAGAVTVDLSNAANNTGDAAGDKLIGIENLTGSDNDDKLVGNAGSNVLEGGLGADTLLGGAGIDFASYAHSGQSVTVDLNLDGQAQASGGDASGDIIGADIEGVIGSDYNDNLIGDNNANRLDGGIGDDTLTAGGGNDVLIGGSGDDSFLLGTNLTAADQIDGGDGNDTLYLDAGAAYAAGITLGAKTLTSVENIVLGDGKNFRLTLNDANNTDNLFVDGSALTGTNVLYLNGAAEKSSELDAIGGAGNDTLIGGGGNDVLVGGAGADILTGGLGFDFVDYFNSAAGVTVNLNLTSAQVSTGDASGDRLNGIEGVVGSDFNDTLIGNAGDNFLGGGAGDDLLIGGAGADQLDGGNGTDTVTYAASKLGVTVDLHISGAQGGVGDAFGDILTDVENVTGSNFADTLIGDVNANVLDGGLGIDTVSYAASKAGVTVNLVTNVNIGGDADGDVLKNIENLVGTSFDDSLTGNDGNNRIDAGDGKDTITSGAGIDVLLGGKGDDTFILGGNLTAADRIDGGAEDKNPDHDKLLLDGDYTAGVVFTTTTVVNIEEIDLAAGHNYKLTLNNATNTHGLTVDGSALGAGDSMYLNGTAETSSALMAIGGAGADTIYGGRGNDVIEGGAGADMLSGGLGFDIVTYIHSAAGVTVDLGNAANNMGDAAGDILSGFEQITGSNNDDILTGDIGSNIFDGARGNDTITGGGGNDTVTYAASQMLATDSSQTGVTVDLLAGTASLDVKGKGITTTFTDTLVGIDNIIGTDFADVITGNGNVNKLSGGLGNDTFKMGGNLTAADRIDGGTDANLGDVDTLELDGDYSAGLVFAATTAVNIEAIDLAGGHSYKLTLNNATNSRTLTVDGTALGAGDTLYLSGAAESSNNLTATGGAGADTIIGGYGSDTLTGGAGADILSGGAGNDVIEGGAGADTINGGLGIDTASYAGSSAAVTVDLSNNANNAGGDAAGDILTAIENLRGSANDDILIGNAGANVLEGGAGADKLDGGLGIDTASYENSGAGVTVDLGDNSKNAGADAAGDVLINIENLTGSTHDDTLIGDGGNNRLDGGAGDDILQACCGNDTLLGGAGNDTFLMEDNLTALDRIDGGDGTDTLSLDGNYAAGLIFAATTMVNVEIISLADGNSYKLTLNNANNDKGLTVDGSTLTGDNNLILNGAAETSGGLSATGGTGDDTLIGGGGGDSLTGGIGNDTITGNGGGDVLDGGAGNDILSGGLGNDILIAGSGFDTLQGGAGDDILEMGAFLTPADHIDGGDGTDTLSLDGDYSSGLVFASTTAINIEAILLADGNSYKLTLNNATNATGLTVDGSLLTGTNSLYLDGSAETTAALTAIGGAGDDTLKGGRGNDLLEGGAGADTLIGGLGTDTATYINSAAGVTVDLSNNANNAGGEAAGDILSGIENLIGSAFNDDLTGDAGNNIFDGGRGSDTITGGGGSDTVTYLASQLGVNDVSQTGVSVDLIAGKATISVTDQNNVTTTFIDTLSGINNIVGTNYDDLILGNDNGDKLVGGFGDDRLGGGAGNDTLTGDAGDDVLRGFAGRDTLTGGAGDDQLEGGAGADILDGGSGFDWAVYRNSTAGVTVDLNVTGAQKSSGEASGDILSGIEAIWGSAYNDRLIGDATDNNRFEGGAGADYIDGGLGNDDTVYYTHSTAGVTVNLNLTGPQSSGGDAHGDVLVSIERLAGSIYDDRLIGNASNNVLAGDLGNDVLTGGGGQDIFQWFTINDGIDTITDFQKGIGGDTLALGDILQGQGVNASNLGDYLRLVQSSGGTLLQVDANGSVGGANFTTLAILQGVGGSDVTAGNFLANGNIQLSKNDI